MIILGLVSDAEPVLPFVPTVILIISCCLGPPSPAVLLRGWALGFHLGTDNILGLHWVHLEQQSLSLRTLPSHHPWISPPLLYLVVLVILVLISKPVVSNGSCEGLVLRPSTGSICSTPSHSCVVFLLRTPLGILPQEVLTHARHCRPNTSHCCV